VLTPRQQLILRKVIEHVAAHGDPVGSKTLAVDPELAVGASTIRHELAILEEFGLLAHPHTSAGRVPTDAGRRWYVDLIREQGLITRDEPLGLDLMRREVDEAMRITSETLSQITNLLAIVSAPPIGTATVRHVELLLLQPQVVMVVVITSTGGVTKRVFTFEQAVDPGLAAWAAEFFAERLTGVGLGTRALLTRLLDPELNPIERAFVQQLAPVFTELEQSAEDTLYVDGAARLIGEHRVQDLVQLSDLLQMLERRAALLGVLRSALEERDVLVRIGAENEVPQLRSLALVTAGYGLPARRLGTVSLIGPVTMDYGQAIGSVRQAALELSHFIAGVYEP